MRAALTTLGIIIGVAAVIAMMEIGRGSSSAIQRAIANMGANSILVLPGTGAGGGAAGIIVGRLVSYLMTAVFRWPTELSLDAIVSAFVISAAVGIIFGYYPAWKASRLDPIMALRYE